MVRFFCLPLHSLTEGRGRRRAVCSTLAHCEASLLLAGADVGSQLIELGWQAISRHLGPPQNPTCTTKPAQRCPAANRLAYLKNKRIALAGEETALTTNPNRVRLIRLLLTINETWILGERVDTRWDLLVAGRRRSTNYVRVVTASINQHRTCINQPCLELAPIGGMGISWLNTC